jgi:hypothetical protein
MPIVYSEITEKASNFGHFLLDKKKKPIGVLRTIGLGTYQ